MDIRQEIKLLLYKFWESLPEPKPCYTVWYYNGRDDKINEVLTNDKEREAVNVG